MKKLKEMEPIPPFEKEDFVCQTCGNEGFTNAFVYCVKCLEFVIHRYCLKVIPKTFTKCVIWYCESCKPPVQNQVTSPQVTSSPPQKNEVKTNIDPILSESSSSDSDSSSSCSNMNEFDEWEARIAQQNQHINRIIDDMIISYPSVILRGDKPFRSSCDGENCKTTESVVHHKKKKKEKKERDIASLIAETKEVLFHPLLEKNLTNKKKEHEVSQMPNFENNVQEEDNYYKHAQPILDPVWRGSIKVLGTDYDDLFEGFVGHLSTKACGKVFEEANMMPSLLILEMHPKTFLWPKSFQDCEPSDDHVALYFFPGDPINERAFDQLVLDMMDEELAMRGEVKNADLLIFTSAALPPFFRRFQGKYYLWGVFRAKRNEPIDPSVLNNTDKCVDMDPESEDQPI
ncbi:uncharacterized protein LOC111883682 isoform X2 [Lactuca sativa]|uniref:uncharacterized protein LOC111883682 isoform X2 n=1 Tax=Lactuca sativa TaxID=4236 RepID=UPI000CD9E4D6|nr:uncharacterized protein LOC111883682 isoform X2 [Lactuca sativa]